MIAYPAAPAVGSLVSVTPKGVHHLQGLIGIVQVVSRDVRTGRALSVGCHWFDADWRRVFTEVAPLGDVEPWAPPAR